MPFKLCRYNGVMIQKIALPKSRPRLSRFLGRSGTDLENVQSKHCCLGQ